MGVVLFFFKTVLLVAVSFAFFFALAAGLGADIGTGLVVADKPVGCEAIDFKNCVFLIF